MFVVFEGIDGSGKTTVSNLVVERLRAAGLTVKHLRAEGKFVSSVSEAIRSLARDSRNLELDPRSEFLLYVARDVQLIEEALREAVRTHDIVIADRFLYTAEVLGRYGRGLPASYTKPVLDAAADGLSPDLVVLIDVDPVLARARRKASKLITKDPRPPSRKGLAGTSLQDRVRRGYLELAAEQPERWFVANNEEILEETVSKVADLVQRSIQDGAERGLSEARASSARVKANGAAVGTPEEALEKLTRWLGARAEREPQVSAYLLSGLFGAPIDEMRRTLSTRVPTVMLAGLTGLSDDVSWSLRESLVEQYPAAVALSIAGIQANDPRAEALTRRLEQLAPSELLRTLSRRDDEQAWSLRERLYEAHPDQSVEGLANVASERATALRERWFKERKAKLSDDYERARVAARSVRGVDDVLAWEIRDAARSAAPIASLDSIGALSCDRSWALREKSLRRATKVVMKTLMTLRDPRAWRMRWDVVKEAKEAVDSVRGLGDEEAWKLRETVRDLWPSTVVKALGPLADEPRGQALIKRQLAAYPHDLSLLKHAAAIALGAHRETNLSEPSA